MEQNRHHARKPLDAPALAVGGEAGLGGLMTQLLEGLAPRLESCVVADCGHYVPEEAPAVLSERPLGFLLRCGDAPGID